MKITILFICLMLAACNAPQEVAMEEPATASAPDIEYNRYERRMLTLEPPAAGFVSPRNDEIVTDIVLQQLSNASMVFSIPDSANISDHLHATLLINPKLTEEALREELNNSGQVISNRILISRIVIAKITAPDFKVTPLTPLRQAISTSDTTSWEWELEPRQTGTHNIYLTITATVQVADTYAQRHIKTFDKVVKIEITTSQLVSAWLSANWQWMWSTLLIPLVVVGWKNRGKVTRGRN